MRARTRTRSNGRFFVDLDAIMATGGRGNRGKRSNGGGRSRSGRAASLTPSEPPPTLNEMKAWPQLKAPEAKLNSRTLLGSAAAADRPLTEDLDEGEEAGFVLPHYQGRRAAHHARNHSRGNGFKRGEGRGRGGAANSTFFTVVLPPNGKADVRGAHDPAVSARSGGGGGKRRGGGGGAGGGDVRSVSCHLFVGNVPHRVDRDQLVDTFSPFGTVLEVILFKKGPAAGGGGSGSGGGPPHFCFVVFADPSSVEAALGSRSDILLAPPRNRPAGGHAAGAKQHRLHVERRRDLRPNAMDRLATRYSVSTSDHPARPTAASGSQGGAGFADPAPIVKPLMPEGGNSSLFLLDVLPHSKFHFSDQAARHPLQAVPQGGSRGRRFLLWPPETVTP